METNILNVYDLLQILTILVILFLLVLSLAERKGVSDVFLPIFLIILLLEPLYIFSFYSVVGKKYLAPHVPFIYFVVISGYFVKAQILLLFLQSTANPDKKLSRKHLLHLLPLAIYFFILALFYDTSISILDNYYAWYESVTLPLTYHFTSMGYAGYILYILFKKDGCQAKNGESDNRGENLVDGVIYSNGFSHRNLCILALAYACTWSLSASSHIFYHITLSNLIAGSFAKVAIGSNLFALFYLFSVLWGRNRNKSAGVSSKYTEGGVVNTFDQYVKSIEHTMLTKKPYLNPEASIETIAEACGLKPANFSMLLNQFYKQNFYHFISQYRIEEAKRLLADTQKYKQIADIYKLAGFNSRTTFNVKFKEMTGKTPSQYRRSVDEGSGEA